MITKMPGFTFSSYKEIAFAPTMLIAEDQYFDIISSIMNGNAEMKYNYEQLLSDYNFTNKIPKELLFVTLSPDITPERRNYIANGIRSYFKDDLTALVEKSSMLANITQILLIVEVLIIVIGMIALVLTFFLLLISTSQNIKENVWELGVLRAIGLN